MNAAIENYVMILDFSGVSRTHRCAYYLLLIYSKKIPPPAQPQSKLYVAEGYTTFSFLVGGCAAGEFFCYIKNIPKKLFLITLQIFFVSALLALLIFSIVAIIFAAFYLLLSCYPHFLTLI